MILSKIMEIKQKTFPNKVSQKITLFALPLPISTPTPPIHQTKPWLSQIGHLYI